MHLWCVICGAAQSVTCPDEADEDPRTQGIRRTFRAEHQICGVHTVRLMLVQEDTVGDALESPAWLTEHPADVRADAEGFFVRDVTRDGQLQAVRVCEDCWQNIPRYVDFPYGLTSPESAKTRQVHIEGKRGVEHVRKAVCLPCYCAAFARTYPGAALPIFNEELVGDGTPVPAPPAPIDEMFVSEPGQEATA